MEGKGGEGRGRKEEGEGGKEGGSGRKGGGCEGRGGGKGEGQGGWTYKGVRGGGGAGVGVGSVERFPSSISEEQGQLRRRKFRSTFKILNWHGL